MSRAVCLLVASAVMLATCCVEARDPVAKRGQAVLVCYTTEKNIEQGCERAIARLSSCGIEPIVLRNKTPAEIEASLQELPVSTPTFFITHGVPLQTEKYKGLGLGIAPTSQQIAAMQEKGIDIIPSVTPGQYIIHATDLEAAIKRKLVLPVDAPGWEGKKVKEPPFWIMSCHGACHFDSSKSQTTGVASQRDEETSFYPPVALDPTTERIFDLLCDGKAFKEADTNKDGILMPHEIRTMVCVGLPTDTKVFQYTYQTPNAPQGEVGTKPKVVENQAAFDKTLSLLEEKFGSENITVKKEQLGEGTVWKLEVNAERPNLWAKRPVTELALPTVQTAQGPRTVYMNQVTQKDICNRAEINGFYLTAPKEPDHTPDPTGRGTRPRIDSQTQEAHRERGTTQPSRR